MYLILQLFFSLPIPSSCRTRPRKSRCDGVYFVRDPSIREAKEIIVLAARLSRPGLPLTVDFRPILH
jgi:hypothetical protein